MTASAMEFRWKNFKAKFKKSYETLAEEEKRFEIFKEHCARFDEHNKLYEEGNVSYTQGVNRDADLDDSEIMEKYEGKPL